MINAPSLIDINHLTVALRQEMTPAGRKDGAHADVLFIGGSTPSEADEYAFAGFGLRKNYKIIYTACRTSHAGAGPSSYHVVVTDGLNEAVALKGGRLWKRDRRSASVLLFPIEQALIKISAKGRMIVRPMTGRYDEQGHELASQHLAARAARKLGRGAVVAPVGGLPVILDMTEFVATFAAAA
jgi:hypothetical protein